MRKLFTITFFICISLITNAQSIGDYYSQNNSPENILSSSEAFPVEEMTVNAQEVESNYSKHTSHLLFTENKGQWNENVEFKAFTKSGTIFLEKDKFTFSFFNKDDIGHGKNSHKTKNEQHECNEKHKHNDKCNLINLVDKQIHMHAYNVSFENCNENPQIEKLDKRPEYFNYFVGNDKSKWKSDVHTYNKIKYHNIYQNIDLLTYSYKGTFKYDFIVAPGANTSNISLSYNGVNNLFIDNNDLFIETSVNTIIETKPYAYQLVNGEKAEVECYYNLEGNKMNFVFPNGYDNTKELIIDPTVLGATFAGTATGSETWGSSATYDSQGNIYIAARAFGATYPTTPGAFMANFVTGAYQITAVSKFSSDATTLIYATYLGGGAQDVPESIIINNGNLYILGTTSSDDFPTTTGSYDNSHNGIWDIYVSCLNPTGTGLIASTYVGGSGNDGIQNMVMGELYGDSYRGQINVDSQGNIYVASFTESPDFPTTAGVIQPNFADDAVDTWIQDGVIFKMNSNLSSLIFSTYFGGTDNDACYGIDVDPNTGDILVVGSIGTNSYSWSGFNSTYQGGFNSGYYSYNVEEDGFVLRLNSTATSILANTYYGTDKVDKIYFVQVDNNSEVYIYGLTEGTITPSAGVFSGALPGDNFIAKLNTDLTNIEFETVLGNGNMFNVINPVAFMVDVCDRIYISGHASLSGYSDIAGYPLTSDALATSGGIYVAVLEENAVSLIFGSYLQGADHVDGGTSRFDNSGTIYQGVCSCDGYSADFTATPGAYQPTRVANSCDMAVYKIFVGDEMVLANFIPEADTLCAPAIIPFENNSLNAIEYIWDFNDGSALSYEVTPTHTFADTGTYNIMLIAINMDACIPYDTTYYPITVVDFHATATTTSAACESFELILHADPPGLTSYEWSGPNGFTASTTADSVSVSANATPAMSGDYTVTITNQYGCTDVATVSATVYLPPSATATNNSPVCEGETFNLTSTPNSMTTYEWSGPGSYVNTTQNPTITNASMAMNGDYQVLITDNNGCVDSVTTTVVVNQIPTAHFIANPILCGNDPMLVTYDGTDNGNAAYSWTFQQGNANPGTGVGPHNVLWNNAGNHNIDLTVTEEGCTSQYSTTIAVPDQIVSTISNTNVLCFGGNDGTINLEATGATPPYTYSWDNGATTQDISNLTANTYIVIITDANNCTASTSAEVTQPTQLISSAEHEDISCFGYTDGTLNLTVSGGTPPYYYSWNNGSTTQDLSNIGLGVFSVDITDNNGCTISDGQTLVEPPPFQITANIIDISCFGYNDGSISLNPISGGTAPYTYNWEESNSTATNLTNLYAGNYPVTVTDNKGCANTNNFDIIEPSKLFVSLPEDFTFCKSNTDILASVSGGTSPYQYQWNTGSTSDIITYPLNINATYSVSITDSHGCTTEDLINIKFVHVDIDAWSNRDTVCPGDPIIADINITGGIPEFTVFNNGQIISYPYTVYPNIHDNYQISVIDACENKASTTIDIYTHPVPHLSFNSDILQGCPPLEIHFNQHTFSNNFSYIWDFDDIDENNLSLAVHPIHTFTESGYYDITVHVTDTNSCENQLTIVDMIHVFPKPEAHFDADPYLVYLPLATVKFTNYSEGNKINSWFFDDGHGSSKVHPFHDYKYSGEYYPELIVENEYGCLDTAIHKIIVQDGFTLYAPSAFSPDGDNINDNFRAVGTGIDLDNYWVGVYDRWGEIIWQANDLFATWGGKAKKGNKYVQNGVYVWLVVCKDFKGNEHTKSGTVNVIR